MKKKVIIITISVIAVVILLAGYFIPIDTYTTLSCMENYHSPRQEVIFGGSLDAIRNDTIKSDLQTNRCAAGGVPQTYSLYLL